MLKSVLFLSVVTCSVIVAMSAVPSCYKNDTDQWLPGFQRMKKKPSDLPNKWLFFFAEINLTVGIIFSIWIIPGKTRKHSIVPYKIVMTNSWYKRRKTSHSTELWVMQKCINACVYLHTIKPLKSYSDITLLILVFHLTSLYLHSWRHDTKIVAYT